MGEPILKIQIIDDEKPYTIQLLVKNINRELWRKIMDITRKRVFKINEEKKGV